MYDILTDKINESLPSESKQVIVLIKTALVQLKKQNKTKQNETKKKQNTVVKKKKPSKQKHLFKRRENKSKCLLGAEDWENTSELQLRKNDYLVFIARLEYLEELGSSCV